MSRSDYSEDVYGWELILWRGAVNSAMKGKRGQALLSEMATALDAMPIKRLIDGDLISEKGEVCALGAVAKHKGLSVGDLDPHDAEKVSAVFCIAKALAREIVYENDEVSRLDTPEERWVRMRKWVEKNLTPTEEIERE